MQVAEIKITRLKDGTLRLETDKIPEAAHDDADAMIKRIVSLCGGEHKVEKIINDQTHLHEHVHHHDQHHIHAK